MKNTMLLCLLLAGNVVWAQSLTGSWQVVEEKTCFESQIKESETEKELKKSMASSQNSVARVIKFKDNGTGEEGVFASGSRKGSSMRAFRYRINGKEILLLDKKSGIMTEQLVIDELSLTTLRVHLAGKECETKAFSRIK